MMQVSYQQTLSSQFLANQAAEGVALTLLAADQVKQVTAASSVDDWQLCVVCQGLNLEKLWQIQTGLAEYLAVKQFSLHKHPSMSPSIYASASVSILRESDLAQKIEELALKSQTELMLTKQAPTLDKPGLLLMDMDSTVIEVECIDEIATLAGVGKQVSEVTELAMQGKLDFAESLRSRVACLKGADEAILHQVRDALPLMPGIESLVAKLQAHGWKLAIASGGFTYYADYLKMRLGLDAAVANQLEIVEGKLTGRVKGSIVDASIKAQTLLELAQQWQIPKQQTIAMGDGANDLVMMEAANLGVAFHAKPIVRTKADAAIRFGGLDTLLCLLDKQQTN